MAEKRNYNKPKENATNSTVAALATEMGKVPPHALDIEEVVLGQLMLEQEAVFTVIDILKPECFYHEMHQILFKAILDLGKASEPVNILTVTEALRKKGELDRVGGPFFIARLSQLASSAAHVEFHAKLIAQKYIQRELIRVSTEIQNRSFDAAIDVADLIDFAEREIFNISQGNIKKDSVQINVLVKEAIRLIEEASKREDGLSGIPSGFVSMDRLTSGWQRSDMIVVAARPAMGKTAFTLSMLRNMAVEHNVPVAMFSLEMSSVQLVTRLVVGETGLTGEKIKSGKLSPDEWKALEERTQTLIQAPIYLDDTPALSIFDFRAKCRRLKQKHDIQMVFIDYLQLMTCSGTQSREQEVSMISRQIKAIAKELNIPIIALSQLNRSVETRGGDKRPQLSDLRESGAIEQDADMVMFIHRPEYYGLTEDEEGNSTRGLAEIVVAKHRNGATDIVKLEFVKEQAKFKEFDTFNGFANATGFDAPPAQPQIKTFGSKMNQDAPPSFEQSFPIGPNTSFDSAPF